MLKKFLIIIAAIFILFLAAFVLMKFEKRNSQSTLSQSIDFPAVGDEVQPGGRIYYISYENDSKQIKYYDAAKNETKTIFNDKNENGELEDFGNFAPISSEFFAYLKDGNKGQLVSFKFGDEIKKNIIRDNFISPESFAMDPSGKIIYYSTASTDKKEHNLYEENRDGYNKRLIYQSDFPILNLQVSSDSNKIIFTENDKRVLQLNLDTFKTRELFQSSGKVYDLKIAGSDNLIFTEVKDGINTGTVFDFNMSENNLKKVLNTVKFMPATATFSPDKSTTSLIQKNFKNNYDKMFSGKLSLVKIGSEKITELDSAISIIYWAPEEE